jgi:tetratricopeptide (TPR) repeat protein
MRAVPDAPRTLFALARRIDDERRRARPIVQSLHATIDEWWNTDVPDEWRTIGFANELCDAAVGELARAPRTAASLAHFAVVILLGIPHDEYPAWVVTEATATAWRRVAQAAQYRSDYEGALKALDATDRLLATNPQLVFDRGLAGFVRALVYSDMHRFGESATLLLESERIFRAHKDRPLQGHCLLLRGMNAHRQHRLTEAATLFKRAAEILRHADDLKHHGLALLNLGLVRVDLQQQSSAATALHDALAIFIDLGLNGEIARTKAVIGRVSMGAGRFEEARDVLTESRRMFLTLGMPEEAGVVGLLLVETFVALRDAFRAAAVTEEVLAEFIRAKLNARAATALAYLREMIPRSRAAEAARHVRQYVDVLRREPERVFVPLPRDDAYGRDS